MGITSHGEIWILGGEDLQPTEQKQEESKDEDGVVRDLYFEPFCTGLMS